MDPHLKEFQNTLESDNGIINQPISIDYTECAQCGGPVKSIKGDSHNYCPHCGFRDSCC